MTVSRQSLVVPGIAAALAFCVLVGLGVWQVQRLQWKTALIARVDERIDAPAVPGPGPQAWPDLDMAELEYLPVTVRGHFLHDGEAHVFTVLSAPRGAYGGMGYQVITPLETEDGWIVYVNRGFVPGDHKEPATRIAGQLVEEQTVTGLLRAPRSRNWFSAEDDSAGNVWFSRDPELFAASGDLAERRVAPYTIDQDFDPAIPGGLPQGGETLLQFPNNHLGYALTWFGLAAALAGVFFVFVRRRTRE